MANPAKSFTSLTANPPMLLVSPLLSPSLAEAPHLHALRKLILYFYYLKESYFGWFFFSACLTLKFQLGAASPYSELLKNIMECALR